MKFIVIAIVASVSAIKLEGVDRYLTAPIPVIPSVAEKTNQYNRQCDHMSPTHTSCVEGDKIGFFNKAG
jgi:hypothetical protein